MSNTRNDLIQLAIDLYDEKAVVDQFTNNDADEALRNKFIEILGTDKVDYNVMRRSGALVFEIIEEALKPLIARRLSTEFVDFADYRNVAWGDKATFEIDNPALFDISIIADGNANLKAQRIEGSSVTVSTVVRGAKFYENFYRLVAGRTNWASFVNKIADSYVNKIYTAVYAAMYASYDSTQSTYNVTGSYSSVVLDNMIDHLEAANNAECMILGTRNALSRVAPVYVSDAMKDEHNKQGFFGIHNGRKIAEIKQTHTNGTNTFAINNNFLMILPVGNEKIVKIVDEGDAVIMDTKMNPMDLSSEYFFMRKTGVELVVSLKNGIYRLS